VVVLYSGDHRWESVAGPRELAAEPGVGFAAGGPDSVDAVGQAVAGPGV